MKYISILRGINVSGQKKIKMADLRELLEAAGLTAVKTYIQSGNVVFSHPKAAVKKLEEKIHQAIKKAFGFEVPVLVLEEKDFRYIVEQNPFLKRAEVEVTKLHVTVMEQVAEAAKQAEVEALSFTPDEFLIDGRYIYVYCPNGYGRTKINNNFFERKLNCKATTRNWKTVNVLWGMINE